ncbi:MAG: TlpA family protein disulfide reductase [Myxococcota bacterium]
MVKDWAIALVVGVGVFFAAEYLSPNRAPDAGPAPAFTLVNVAGGTTSLSEFAGRPVVLNFWGSWCPPCKQEIPEFAAYVKANPEVPVLGIAVNSGTGDRLKRDAETLGVNYPVLEGTDEVLAAYGVSAYPTTFVVAPDGTISSVFQGAIGKETLSRAVAGASAP